MRLIDADAAATRITENLELVMGEYQFGAETIAALVRNALKSERITPTIDPVTRGWWVKMTGMLPPEYHGHYECSECQWHMKGIRNSWTREEEMSYCPNCGAKMDGDGDAR